MSGDVLSPDITSLERAAAAHWQAADQEWLGSWLLRADGGFTGRANSVLPLGAPGVPLADAVDRAEAWYAARGLPAMVSVPAPAPALPVTRAQPAPGNHPAAGDGGSAGGDPAAGGADGATLPDPLDELLAGRGWRVRSGAVVMTAAVAQVVAAARRAAARGSTPVTFADQPDGGWLARYRYRGQDLPPAALRLLLSAPWQAFASVVIGGRTVAVGRVSVAAGWAGLTAIDVDPGHQRAGLGTAVTTALVAAAARRGVRRVFLQTEAANIAARALYERCGFQVAHRYHYRVAPA